MYKNNTGFSTEKALKWSANYKILEFRNINMSIAKIS